MMGSCSGMSSSLHTSRYVSWCLDSAALTAAAPEESLQQNHQAAGSGSVPLLLLSPPEASGGETNAALSHQRRQSAHTKRTHHKASTLSCLSQMKLRSSSAVHNISKVPHHHHVEDNDSDEGTNPSVLHPDKTFLLPRSSPVISRRHTSASWHGGSTGSSEPPSSLSLDQCGSLTIIRMEDLGSKPSPCPLQSLPFRGQHEDSRRQELASCDVPHSSAQHSKERRFNGIPELPADIFKSTCELEKENAHFIVVDMMLEVLEGVKWTLSSERWTSHCDMCTNKHWSSPHEQRCEEERERNTEDEEEEEAGDDEAEHLPKTSSILSTDSGFEDCGVDAMLTPSAEGLARLLVLEFRRSWLPSHEPLQGRLSLRSSLQELPGTGGAVVSSSSSSSLAEEIRLRTRMRGSLSWAPPRCQIIFTVQPNHRRSEVVALQHFLCAGCGTKVEPRYIKKLRYCEYLGRYFCDCCHSGSEAVIPGRLLSCWDFGRYPVSDFSKQLLDSVWRQPLFDLTCVGKTLYRRVKELDKFRELQEQLMDIKKLLTACRLSERVLSEFKQFPSHLTEKPLLFSMDDLLKVKKGHLVSQVRSLLHSAVDHVENCELCLARGFFCEFCRERDIIFPFQRDRCRRCPVCRACFHKHCFVEKKCPKCARIQSRQKHRDGAVK